MNPLRRAFLSLNDLGYQAIKPVIFRQSAQNSHERIIDLLADADDNPALNSVASIAHQLAFKRAPQTIGSITLNQAFILAAGFVKGHGFRDEARALAAVAAGRNIIPGWRIMPKLVGLVEFGSFTRHPRIGNRGTVMWRDVATQSTQNRVGLKNPGAVAAATFLQKNILDLPPQFGINIAVSPGVNETVQQVADVRESIHAFLSRGIVPNWFTLNISCPNTEDDPSGNQTDTLTRTLCEAAIVQIAEDRFNVPLWVKVSPDLAAQQYDILMRVFAETGVQAVIATNTIGHPTPHDSSVMAGVGGGALYPHALEAANTLIDAKHAIGAPVEVIGCGGILEGSDYVRYKARGIRVVQYWSALVYRGPLAAALIEGDVTA